MDGAEAKPLTNAETIAEVNSTGEVYCPGASPSIRSVEKEVGR